MSEDRPAGGFRRYWRTLPGVITAIATLITAVAGLVTALYTTGVVGGNSTAPTPSVAQPTPPPQQVDRRRPAPLIATIPWRSHRSRSDGTATLVFHPAGSVDYDVIE